MGCVCQQNFLSKVSRSTPKAENASMQNRGSKGNYKLAKTALKGAVMYVAELFRASFESTSLIIGR